MSWPSEERSCANSGSRWAQCFLRRSKTWKIPGSTLALPPQKKWLLSFKLQQVTAALIIVCLKQASAFSNDKGEYIGQWQAGANSYTIHPYPSEVLEKQLAADNVSSSSGEKFSNESETSHSSCALDTSWQRKAKKMGNQRGGFWIYSVYWSYE
jgi:hypothetical protein